MRKLLFVCSGNTCRSPLALAAWRALQKSGKAPADVEAVSAGMMASAGAPAARHATSVARNWKQDLSTHLAKLLSPETAQAADWIVVMSPSHVLVLHEYFGIDESKILLLGAFDSQADDTRAAPGQSIDEEILDPFGGSREAYETCAARIHRAVEALATAIERREV